MAKATPPRPNYQQLLAVASGCALYYTVGMVNPDQLNETINKAVSKGVAEMRTILHEASNRFETEVKKFADAVGVDERLGPDRVKNAGEQLQSVVEMIRTEAQNAAGQFSEGINDAVDEFRDFVQENVPGTGRPDGADSASAAGATGAAKKSTAKKAAKKAPAKKAAKKSTAKKSAAKKSTAKKASAKKAPAKKSTAKKSTAKKAAAKKAPAKKTAKKAPAKKSTAKKSTAKKATAKKAAKKSTAKKTAKKATKKP